MGILEYGNTCKRAYRTFLVPSWGVCSSNFSWLSLKNSGYSPLESCSEMTLRLEFERNVLNYLHLATTLSVLPVVHEFRKNVFVRNAELVFDECSPELRASHILVDGKRLYHTDVILGPNPLGRGAGRGWCVQKKLTLQLIIFAARVEHRPVQWQDMKKIVESLPEGNVASSCQPLTQVVLERMDMVAVSNPPALVGIDQRPVFNVQIRDQEAYKHLDKAVCGYGVFDLEDVSRMYCVNCGDCTSRTGLGLDPLVIEDRSVSSMEYFDIIDTDENARRFGDKRMRVPPVKVQTLEGLWSFRCVTDEDMLHEEFSPAEDATHWSILEQWPGVAPLLATMKSGYATSAELAAEAKYLKEFQQRHGGPPRWLARGRATVKLLEEAAEELENDLNDLMKSLR